MEGMQAKLYKQKNLKTTVTVNQIDHYAGSGN